jgi:hypothetical protein
MTDQEYQEMAEQFNKVVAEISAFDNLVEDCLDDRHKYLTFNNMLCGILGEMGNLADFLDLDCEI